MGVQAEDAAGNQVKKVIRFEIRPGKSIVQKIWKPVEDLFSGHGEETENKMDQWIWAEIFGAAGILILLWYGWRMKEREKEENKKSPIKGRMPGNRRPAPGKYYEKVYLK